MQKTTDQERLLSSISDICTATPAFTDQDKLFCFSMPGEEAEDAWLQLREQVETSGFWPVILGTVDDCEEQVYAANHIEEMGFDPVAAMIARGESINVAQWMEQRVAEAPDCFETDENQPDFAYSPVAGLQRKYNFYSLVDLQKKYHSELIMTLVPTRKSWEVPAYLAYGGWNECPLPEEHVALFKHWSETYHADVFAMSGDVVELYVRKPPTTVETAMKLAREQFIYAPDIVLQGTDTVHALAQEIINANGWFFWWD